MSLPAGEPPPLANLPAHHLHLHRVIGRLGREKERLVGQVVLQIYASLPLLPVTLIVAMRANGPENRANRVPVSIVPSLVPSVVCSPRLPKVPVLSSPAWAYSFEFGQTAIALCSG